MVLDLAHPISLSISPCRVTYAKSATPQACPETLTVCVRRVFVWVTRGRTVQQARRGHTAGLGPALDIHSSLREMCTGSILSMQRYTYKITRWHHHTHCSLKREQELKMAYLCPHISHHSSSTSRVGCTQNTQPAHDPAKPQIASLFL